MSVQVASGPLGPEQLADWYAAPRPAWVRAGFVTTLDGRVTGADGRSGSLNAGSPGDHAVFGALREWADVVVVGAGTARAEGYAPLSTSPLVVVARAVAEVPEELREVEDVLVLDGGGQDVEAEQVLSLLRDHGWDRVLLEGGPELFASWVGQGVVDELCVTVRPVLAGGSGPLLQPLRSNEGRAAGPDLLGRATHLLEWEGDLLVRTRLR
ncbi:dihydrofolate reductase family protein [Serinicoccus sp. LYQ131]|uniref:dihydrofolate reductase family protein n=1 Tax=Serinicoccus sp. LYQ131 TaxID=3378797 RepID=UPI003853D650